MRITKKIGLILFGTVLICLLGVNYVGIKRAQWILFPTKECRRSILFNLSSVNWPNLPRPNVSTPEDIAKLHPFDVRTSAGQKRSLEILLEVFSKAMDDANLSDQWFL